MSQWKSRFCPFPELREDGKVMPAVGLFSTGTGAVAYGKMPTNIAHGVSWDRLSSKAYPEKAQDSRRVNDDTIPRSVIFRAALW